MKKIKFIVFIIILAILIYFSVGYTYELYKMSIPQIDMSDASNAVVDGADFSFAIMIMGYGVNGFLNFITKVSYTLIVFVASLILIIPFSFICINRKKGVTEEDYKLYKNMYILAVCVSLLLCMMLSKMTGLLFILLLNGTWALISFLFVLLRARMISKERRDM